MLSSTSEAVGRALGNVIVDFSNTVVRCLQKDAVCTPCSQRYQGRYEGPSSRTHGPWLPHRKIELLQTNGPVPLTWLPPD